MPRVAEAVSHGAVTIVNGMATGKGAAVGVRLWTRAKVTLTNQPGLFKGCNLSDPDEDTSLNETTAQHVFRKFRADRHFGALVETYSNIPVAVGLKSSSAASNAIALASLKVLNKKVSDILTVKMGVRASLQAGVTLTGAYDDACACYFGGVVITDNTHRRILKRFKPKGQLRVLIHVPNRKKYTSEVDQASLRKVRSFVQIAHREALRGNYWNSLTLNGLIYCKAFGYDTKPIRDALNEGAIAAGLTGKGPAVAAIVSKPKIENVLSAWDSLRGRIIETSFNFQKAKPLRMASWT
jgi:shikimate kinase